MDVLDFADAGGWESWLAEQHGVQAEAWLRIAKRHSGLPGVKIADALDVALCYGWIDGQRKALDDLSFLQRYSRRRPRSSWSQINVAKMEALTAAGSADPAGYWDVEAIGAGPSCARLATRQETDVERGRRAVDQLAREVQERGVVELASPVTDGPPVPDGLSVVDVGPVPASEGHDVVPA